MDINALFFLNFIKLKSYSVYKGFGAWKVKYEVF